MILLAPGREGPRLDQELRTLFARLIEQGFGLRLSEQQASNLDGVVADALSQGDHQSPWALYRALTEGRLPHLLESIAMRLTVGETHFFRIPAQIEALKHTVLPDLTRRRARDRRLRIWTAGCSTGEEPYTLTILLREQRPAFDEWDIRLLATDFNRSALDAAERAVYGDWSFRDTPASVREQYFTPQGRYWRLADAVRQSVHFVPVNLASDPLAALGLHADELDLILCRNVTIYFGPEAAQRLYRQLALALAPGGWLILGPSDPPPQAPDSLQPRYLPGAVLWQKEASFPGPQPGAPPAPLRLCPRPRPAHPRVQRAEPAGQRRSEERPNRSGQVLGSPPAPPEADRLRVLVRHDRSAARGQAEATARAGSLEPDVYLLLGMLYLDEGDLQGAVETLRRASFLQPDSPLAHFGLGRAYRQIGHAGRARAAFVHARRILTGRASSDILADADGLTVDDLQHAISAQLSEMRRESEGW